MAATPRPGTAGPESVRDWLSGLDDDALTALLRARPDVATPPPASLDVVASRLRLPASTARAVEALDTPTLLVLATAAALGADSGPVPVREVARRLAVRVGDPVLRELVGRLRGAALLWGSTDAVRMSPVTASAVAAAPVVAPAAGEPAGAALERAWQGIGEQARSMLGALSTARVPRGALPEDPASPAAALVDELEGAGLMWVGSPDPGTPATVQPTAHALDRARHGPRPAGRSLLEPPEWRGTRRPQADTDAAAGVALLELLHRCRILMELLERAPAASLRAGGVGVRETRRIARALGLAEHEPALLLEVLAAAGLIALGDAEVSGVEHEDVWAPTDEYDAWRVRSTARRAAVLIRAWWQLPRRPFLVGTELDQGGTAAALSDALSVPAAVTERAQVIGAAVRLVADLDPPPEVFREVVRWDRPARLARGGAGAVESVVAEARVLGLLVGGAPTTAARALVAAGRDEADGADGSPETPESLTTDGLAELLAAMLPEPVSEVIVQADLTILAPGPLVPELAEEFDLLAEVESTGAATTYRVTETSLRRALDAGRTAAGITELLSRTSATPVPQAMDYLVEDVARRHGRLRVGSAMSVVRCDDAALVAQVAASPVAARCAIRAVAPTVLISQAAPLDLVDALREAGFAPVVEDTSGAVVSLTPRMARVVPTPTRRAARVPVQRPGPAELRAAVALLRSADRAATAGGEGAGARRTGEAAVALLHECARTATAVTVEVVDAAGRAATHLVVPVAVGGGRLEGIEPETGRPVRLTLHRVVSVRQVRP